MTSAQTLRAPVEKTCFFSEPEKEKEKRSMNYFVADEDHMSSIMCVLDLCSCCLFFHAWCVKVITHQIFLLLYLICMFWPTGIHWHASLTFIGLQKNFKAAVKLWFCCLKIPEDEWEKWFNGEILGWTKSTFDDSHTADSPPGIPPDWVQKTSMDTETVGCPLKQHLKGRVCGRTKGEKRNQIV